MSDYKANKNYRYQNQRDSNYRVKSTLKSCIIKNYA